MAGAPSGALQQLPSFQAFVARAQDRHEQPATVAEPNLIGDYRNTGRMAMAAYPVQQGDPMVHDFGPKSTPWVFTSMYCPKTVQQGENGLPGQNTTWTDSFRALQHT